MGVGWVMVWMDCMGRRRCEIRVAWKGLECGCFLN
jgi:hypothetical protein